MRYRKFYVWNHPFNTYTRFAEKLKFLPPEPHTDVSGGKKCKYLRKFCVFSKWMIPMANFIVSLKLQWRRHFIYYVDDVTTFLHVYYDVHTFF